MVSDAQTALKRTLKRLQAEKARTEKQIKAVSAALQALGVSAQNLATRRKRRPMDAAERRLVSRRMRAYWAKRKAAKSS